MTWNYGFYNADLRRAIDTNNVMAMRVILDVMRRNNIGEALVPGLRDLCKEARKIITAENMKRS